MEEAKKKSWETSFSIPMGERERERILSHIICIMYPWTSSINAHDINLISWESESVSVGITFEKKRKKKPDRKKPLITFFPPKFKSVNWVRNQFHINLPQKVLITKLRRFFFYFKWIELWTNVKKNCKKRKN